MWIGSLQKRNVYNEQCGGTVEVLLMRLRPFLLDAWLEGYEHDMSFTLAASTGPTRRISDIMSLAADEMRYRFLNHNLVYRRPASAHSLREAIRRDAAYSRRGGPSRDWCLRGAGSADVAKR